MAPPRPGSNGFAEVWCVHRVSDGKLLELGSAQTRSWRTASSRDMVCFRGTAEDYVLCKYKCLM